MLGKYELYATKRVALQEVLQGLDTLKDTLTKGVLTYSGEQSSDWLARQVGLLQGVERALNYVKRTFGEGLNPLPE